MEAWAISGRPFIVANATSQAKSVIQLCPSSCVDKMKTIRQISKLFVEGLFDVQHYWEVLLSYVEASQLEFVGEGFPSFDVVQYFVSGMLSGPLVGSPGTEEHQVLLSRNGFLDGQILPHGLRKKPYTRQFKQSASTQ